MFIGEIIKDYRTKNNLSQRAFASRTSLSPSYINTLEKIYNPKTGKPYSVTTDVALELAKAMFISIEDLLSMLDKNQEFVTNTVRTDILGNPVVSLPLLGTVKAGYNYLVQENWIGTVDVEKNLVGDGKDYFALKVKGDSMAPVFVEGDIVIIKKQNDCENNEYAVVIINGDEGTLKKIKKTDNGIILQPLNPAYGPVMYTKEEMETIPIIIVGVVKQLKREF